MFPLLCPSLSLPASLSPIIHPAGLRVRVFFFFFPLRVILPAWLVWRVELVDAADTLVRCGMARSAGRSDGDSKTLLLSLLRGQCGHAGRAAQTKLFPTLTQQKVGVQMHGHTLTSTNLEDRAVEWFDEAISLLKRAYSVRNSVYCILLRV